MSTATTRDRDALRRFLRAERAIRAVERLGLSDHARDIVLRHLTPIRSRACRELRRALHREGGILRVGRYRVRPGFEHRDGVRIERTRRRPPEGV